MLANKDIVQSYDQVWLSFLQPLVQKHSAATLQGYMQPIIPCLRYPTSISVDFVEFVSSFQSLSLFWTFCVSLHHKVLHPRSQGKMLNQYNNQDTTCSIYQKEPCHACHFSCIYQLNEKILISSQNPCKNKLKFNGLKPHYVLQMQYNISRI